jgi:WD40 repeat protein
MLEEHRTAVQCVRFSPDGKKLASGSSDLTINVWDVKDQSATVEKTLQGHSAEIRAVSFSHDGKYLVSGSGQKELFVWSTDDYSIQGEGTTTGEVDGAEFLPDQLAFVTADGSGTIIRWEIEELEEMLEPFNNLLKEIESDPELTRKDEHIRKFEEIQSQHSEATLKDKRVFYIMWQCKRALGLLKGTVRKS